MRWLWLILGVFAIVKVATGEDLAVSDKFHSESAEILVTLATASRLNQCDVLAYYPKAKFMFLKELRTRVGKNANIRPAKLFLDENRKESVTVGFDSTFGEAGIVWKVPVRPLLHLLRKHSSEIPIEVIPEDKDSEGDKNFEVFLDPKAEVARQLRAIPRKSKRQVENKVEFESLSAETAVVVHVVPRGRADILIRPLRAGMPHSKNNDFSRLENKEKKEAWTAGRYCFGEHYFTSDLLMRSKYEGPDEEGEIKDAGSYMLMVAWGQTKGVIVVPTLETKRDPKKPGEEGGIARKAFPPIAVDFADFTKDTRNIKRFSFEAHDFFKEVLSPILLRGNEGTLNCLDIRVAEEKKDGQIKEVGCVKNAEGTHRIWVHHHREKEGANDFLVTDAKEEHVWTVQIQTTEEQPSKELRGNYFPIRISDQWKAFTDLEE